MPATQQTHDKKRTKYKTTSLSDKPTQLHTGSIATKFKSWCGIMKSKRKMSEHSPVNEEWSALFKKAIRESKKKKRFIREKMKEEEKKKKVLMKKPFNIGRDCTTRETIPMKIFVSSTGHPSTHRQEHGRLWIRHVCGEQKKMVVQWNRSNECGNI